MNRDVFITTVIDKYKNMNITDFKYTVGTQGVHVDFKFKNSDIIQYDYIKFEE